MSEPLTIAVLEERIIGIQRGIELQALEYERRLSDLNHAHEKQVEDQQTYVSIDVYNAHQKETYAWRNAVDKELSVLQGRTSGRGSMISILLQLVPIVISIVFGLIVIFKR